MPKKKPIAKRLSKLFQDIKPEETPAAPKRAPRKRAAEEQAPIPVEIKPAAQSKRPVEMVTRLSNAEPMSLAFQTGHDDWATLQVIDDSEERRWTPDEQLLVKQVTDQLSLALENAYLFQETQSRAEDLAVLNELGQELSTLIEVDKIAEAVYRHTSRLMDTTNLFISLYEEKTEELNQIIVINNNERVAIPPRKLGHGLSDYIIRTGEPLFMPEDVPGHMKKLGIDYVPLGGTKMSLSWVGVPLLVGKSVRGVIGVQSLEQSNLYNEADRDILIAIAGRAAVALENARLFQESQSRAEDLSVLNEMGNELSTKLDPKAIAEVVYRYTSRLMDTKNFYLSLYDENKDEKTYPLAYENGRAIELGSGKVTGRGFTDYIIRNKKVVFAPSDVAEHRKALGIEFVPLSDDDTPSLSWLGVPMLVGSRVLGVISVQSVEASNLYDSQDREILTTIANQAAIAVENARLFQESQRRAQEMSALAEVGREVSATLDLKTVLEKIAEYAIILLNSVTSAVYIPDSEFKTLIPFAVMGDEAEEIKNDHLQVGKGILGNIALSRTGEIVNDVYKDSRAITIQGTTENVPDEHLMAAPITLQDRVTGLMAIWRVGKGVEFNETEFNFLKNLAQQAAIAIENARLFQDVTNSQGQLSEALRIARIGYFEIDWIANTITFTDELFALLNTTAEKEEGYTLPLQQALQKFVIPEDVPVATKAVQDAIASEDDRSEVTSEVRYKTTDGRIIWVSSTYKVERDNKGQPVKIAGSSQDITERKTNELTQAAITQISESALTSKTAEELFQTVHQSIQTILPARNFYVALYDRTANLLSFPYHADELDDDWTPRRLGRGLTGYVIRSGKPLRTTPEIFSDLEASGEILSDGAPSVDWMGVPLKGEGVVRGVMAVQTYDNSIRITENQAENFEIIGAQTAAALERLQARESLQRRNTYLAASSEIGRLVTSTLDIKTIFTRTVNLVSDRLGFYFAAIYQLDEDGFYAILREGTGGAGESMKIQKHRVASGSQTIIGKAVETGELVLANNVLTEPLYQPNPLLLDTQSEVAIPLKVGGRVLGVISIQSTQAQSFTPDVLSVLQSLADQVAVAINNATLYDESQELIKTLKEVDQLKSQFLANMSHELRTPLNSIIGFSRVIIKGIDGPITEMQMQDLTAIYNSGQHLLGLINDILDLARIEAGKMELNFEEVHLAEMVASVMSTAKGLVKEKPIQLVPKIPADMPTVRGDTMRVRQVLINLLSNASKFTDEGTITVEAHVQQGSNGKPEAIINVIDTGPGISQEGQEKLFKAFSQVDGSATRKSGGSGLGLSICANLVQLHGGRISVHSEEGKGSTFWFTLPLFNQPVDEIPEGAKIVLAIDDDPQVISLYERYLTPQGYHVVPLTDPAKAKERILELKPFAVTLDIMMPGTDGWTVLTNLKSDPDTREIPVVICSIMEQPDKGFSLGASDYLVKPILEEDLVHALDRLNKNGDIREVLVIDDDPNDLRLIEKILNEKGQYKPILAEGGKAGWEMINQKAPSAIILDIFMPEMNGFTILEKLREDPLLRDIPVLVVSGGGLTNEQHQQLEDFGQRLITKGSLKETELIANIENALNRINNNTGKE